MYILYFLYSALQSQLGNIERKMDKYRKIGKIKSKTYPGLKAIMVGENVVKLTEIAYIPLYTSMYLLIPMKPPKKICTAVSEGSREYPHKLSEKQSRGQRFKDCGLSVPLLDEAIKYTP